MYSSRSSQHVTLYSLLAYKCENKEFLSSLSKERKQFGGVKIWAPCTALWSFCLDSSLPSSQALARIQIPSYYNHADHENHHNTRESSFPQKISWGIFVSFLWGLITELFWFSPKKREKKNLFLRETEKKFHRLN